MSKPIRTKRNCDRCGKEYDALVRELRIGRGQHCSRKCGSWQKFRPNLATVLTVSLSYGIVPITKGRYAIVDIEDIERVAKFFWKSRMGYAERHRLKAEPAGPNTISMHAFLCTGEVVDHRNGNGLDNRRKNLRPATCQQNSWNARISKRNSSGFKGVNYDIRRGKWMARISDRFLGRFDTAEEAGAAYRAEAIRCHGEFVAPEHMTKQAA